MRLTILFVLLLCSITAFAQQYLAAYVKKDGVWLLIDPTGNPVTKAVASDTAQNAQPVNTSPKHEGDTAFSEGVYCIATGSDLDRRYKYVDRTGKLITDSAFSLGEPFKGGYAMVMIGDTINAIDKQGRFLLQRVIPFMHPFNDALSILSDRILVLPPAKDKTCNCRNSLALYGYMKRSGEWAIEPDFIDADIFVHGLARASMDGQHYGYIGSSGEWAIEPVYEEAERFELIDGD